MGIPWNVLFPFAVWMIWKHRNQVVFTNKGPNLNLSKVIQMQASEYLLGAIHPTCNNHMVLRQIRWEKPESGWLKLNTDGSSNGVIGTVAGGGLIRDVFGNWVTRFTRRIGRADSFATEIWALQDGLRLCRQLNLPAIIVELDAKALVEVLNNPSYYNSVISPLLDDYKCLISQFP